MMGTDKVRNILNNRCKELNNCLEIFELRRDIGAQANLFDLLPTQDSGYNKTADVALNKVAFEYLDLADSYRDIAPEEAEKLIDLCIDVLLIMNPNSPIVRL